VRRWWWLSLLGFFLLGSAWAAAQPANASYDEKDHVVRAYAVAGGHLLPHALTPNWRGWRTPAFQVPASLLPTNASIDCTWADDPPRIPTCQQWQSGHAPVLTPTGASRYSPVYYLPVGIPLHLWPSLTGIVLARMLSALMSALLLAGAVTAAARLRSRLLPLGVVLATTPLVMSLAGAVNPNGLEISAGILAFCALLALLRAPQGRLSERDVRRLLAMLAVAAALLLTLRQLGPLLLALAVAACALAARPGRVRDLLRRRDARWTLGGTVVGGLAYAVGWVAYSGLGDSVTGERVTHPLGLGEALGRILSVRAPVWAEQAVGQFGYGEVHLPVWARLAWLALVLALAVPALVLAGRRLRLATLGLALATFGLLIVMDLYFLPRLGWFSQGRYAMPAAVGVVLLPASGFRLAARVRGDLLRAGAAAVAAACALLQVYALALTMTRYQAGPGAGLDPLATAWRPLLGPVPPLASALVGLVALVVVVAGLAHPGRGDRPAPVPAARREPEASASTA
jgi:hypothetical protein